MHDPEVGKTLYEAASAPLRDAEALAHYMQTTLNLGTDEYRMCRMIGDKVREASEALDEYNQIFVRDFTKSTKIH